MSIYNHSIALALFKKMAISYAQREILVVVVDGCVFAGEGDMIARFADDQAASACLKEAGYLPDPANQELVFLPPGSLTHFRVKYGPDFEKKLSLYATAKLRGQPVSLKVCDAVRRVFVVQDTKGEVEVVDLCELDDFVL